MPNLIIKNVNKIYNGNVQAVKDFNLEVNDHDFVVLVGPSGCGKSTMIRMIAGLEEITSGEMILDGVKINDKAPSERNISMVFQDYALYGNMSVYDNIGFPLTIKKKPKEEIYDAVIKAQNVVNLTDDQMMRMPKQLSGGQKQRVALGRTITKETKLCLMDEPLSNLDAKLRGVMRSEIIKLYNEENQTIIYVTHDQIEAMTMATKIVCLDQGVIQQVGTPAELYFDPANLFVARFIGSSPINLIKGRIENHFFVDGENVKVDLRDSKYKDIENLNDVTLSFRAEAIKLADNNNYEVKGNVFRAEFLGDRQLVHMDYKNERIVASIANREDYKKEQELYFTIDKDKLRLFDTISEVNLGWKK